MSKDLFSLSPVRVATLSAAAQQFVPHAFVVPSRGDALITALVQRVDGLAPDMRTALETALDLLGNRWATLATGHHPLPFHLLAPEEQARLLDRWLRSRVGSLRTVVQAVRRLVLLVEYATPVAHSEIGYRGPYHRRTPELAWEGPLQRDRRPDDPLAYRDVVPAPTPRPASFATSTPAGGGILRAEVVVVGSGAGGAVVASVLAEAGHDVLVLEAGAANGPSTFDEQEATALERLYADSGLRATDDLAVSLLQGATLGGGTAVNWMAMLRTPDWVIDEWQRLHGTEGMAATDLTPLFETIEHDLHARAVPDDAHSPNNRLLLDGARSLGWAVRAAHINARDCRRTGFCGHGCRYEAKQDALQVYLPRAVTAGARVMVGAHVERIDFAERTGPFPLKRVHVRSQTATGSAAVIVEAPVVILAAGAVGTPVILQRSALGGDGVGRFLRLHPTTVVLGLGDEEIYGAAGIPLSVICDEHLRSDQNGYGFWLECPPLHPALAAVALPGFGSAHRDWMQRFRHLSSTIALVRDGAELGLSSGDVSVARTGRVRVRYRLGARDAAHLVAAIEAAARVQLAAGVHELRTLHTTPVVIRSEKDFAELRTRTVGANDIGLFSAHVNGTCRLGSDRATSGVDPHGERWGSPGVFVADGSLLPTAPGVNPQETIMALAHIVAARIAARRRPG